MDISKLPKLSKSEEPAAPVDPAPAGEVEGAPAAGPKPIDYAGRAAPQFNPSAAEAWISIGVGILLLLMTPNTLGYFSSKIFHTHFAPFADPTRPAPAKCDFLLFSDGTKIFYRDSDFFWSDLVITAFAITLILDGVLLVRARSARVVWYVLLVTVVATAANLLYLLGTFSTRGLPIISALAVIFGGYIASYQWRLFKLLAAVRGTAR